MAGYGVTIQLDRPRTLRYGINALMRAEELLGRPITSLNFEKLGITDIIKLAYAGLIIDDKTLTIEKLGDLIDMYGSLEDTVKGMSQALEEAFGPKPGAPRLTIAQEQ